jgi:hypothetical protein
VCRAALSELLVEIGAHARAITAIDIHPVQVDSILYRMTEKVSSQASLNAIAHLCALSIAVMQ